MRDEVGSGKRKWKVRELENFSVYLKENFELYEFECWNWSWSWTEEGKDSHSICESNFN